MEGIELQSLIHEILNGSTRAVVAILLLVIVVLVFEIRNTRKENRLLQERAEAQRGDFLKILTESQTQVQRKSDDMMVKYYNLVSEMQLNLNSFQGLLHNLNKNLVDQQELKRKQKITNSDKGDNES